MRKLIPLGAFASVAVLGLAALPAWAGAIGGDRTAPVPPPTPGVVVFEGTLVNLAKGWGEARACVVARSAGIVECFRSADAMAAREAQIQPSAGRPSRTTAAAASSFTCSSPLRLYENTNYGGRQLSFWDEGLWQNLGDWGFNDQLSSYKIGSCYAHLAEDAWGGGWWYPGDTSPFHWESSMSSGWNDRVSSIYNE